MIHHAGSNESCKIYACLEPNTSTLMFASFSLPVFIPCMGCVRANIEFKFSFFSSYRLNMIEVETHPIIFKFVLL